MGSHNRDEEERVSRAPTARTEHAIDERWSVPLTRSISVVGVGVLLMLSCANFRVADGDGTPSGSAGSSSSGSSPPPDPGDGSAGTTTSSGGPPSCVPSAENCGACGQPCSPPSTATTSSACSSGRCVYSCAAGFTDCNGATTKNLDGCECHGTTPQGAACCGAQCPVLHHSGEQYSPTFYSCVASGTYSRDLALEACSAMGLPGVCTQQNCGDGNLICALAGGDGAKCYGCWAYSGSIPGRYALGGGTTACTCPTQVDRVMWD